MSTKEGRFNRCYASIVSATGQMTVYIWITFAIVMYFYTLFWFVITHNSFVINVNADSCPKLFNYFSHETNEFISSIGSQGHKIGFIDFSDAAIDYRAGNYTVIKLKGSIDDFRGTGDRINIDIEQKSSFDSEDIQTGRKHCKDTILKINKEAGKEIAYLVYPILNDNDAIVLIKFSENGVYHTLAKGDVIVQGRRFQKCRFKNFPGKHNSFVWCKIIVPQTKLSYKGELIGSFLEDKTVLTSMQKAIWFSPFLTNSKLKAKAPLFVVFTVVFGIMATIYGAYTKEKISSAYKCNKNCTRRSILLVLVPLWAAINIFGAYSTYLTLNLNRYDPIKQWDILLYKLGLPVLVVSALYLTFKGILRTRYAKLPINEVWKKQCIENDNSIRINVRD